MPGGKMAQIELRLIGGYQFDEVASALQKSIRSNEEYNACFWLYILYQSGYYKYCWKRLMVIASEDIGKPAIYGGNCLLKWERGVKQLFSETKFMLIMMKEFTPLL
jgi:hypothetical protein